MRFTARAFRKLLSFYVFSYSLLVLRAGYGIWLYLFLIIAHLFTFEISDIERDIIQSRLEVLLRLRGCAGWSAPLLFAYGINRFSHDVAQFLCCRRRITNTRQASIRWVLWLWATGYNTVRVAFCVTPCRLMLCCPKNSPLLHQSTCYIFCAYWINELILDCFEYTVPL